MALCTGPLRITEVVFAVDTTAGLSGELLSLVLLLTCAEMFCREPPDLLADVSRLPPSLEVVLTTTLLGVGVVETVEVVI